MSELLTSGQKRAIDLLPTHMKDGAKSYLIHGQPPGGFHRAVLENDLLKAFEKADEQNRYAMFEWACYLNCIPRGAWGSDKAIQSWIESGGLAGQQKERDQ